MTSGQTRYDTGITSSGAILPGPPPMWSYSSLREAQTCPRRYSLARATYPDLWAGRGYPRVPVLAALFGDIVHDALDTIVKALVAAGCQAVQSPEAVEVLRQLGGYTTVIEHAADARLASLPGNPRVSDDLRQRIQRALTTRIADARVQVQAYISNTIIVPAYQANGAGTKAPRQAPDAASDTRRVAISTGTHAEVQLTVPQLRLTGRIDLLRVTPAGAHITDYKTGAESPGHAEQLQLYALLWDLDRGANPGRLPVVGLNAAYPGRDVAIPVPDESALRSHEKQVTAAMQEADAELAAAVPRAVPSAENCAHCDVRHLCDAYWSSVAPDPAELPDQAWFDCQGVVGNANGPHSWWLHIDQPGQGKLLVQAPQSGPELRPGRHVRIRGLRIDTDPDSDSGGVVASMSAATEVFTMAASSDG